MNKAILASVGPILAAPWQQRRNLGSPWGIAVVVGLFALAPTAFALWSVVESLQGWRSGNLTAAHMQMAGELRNVALNAAVWSFSALALGWWAMAVASLLEQNRPAFARLVPHHPARLRAALLVGWALLVAFVTWLVGFRFDEPLACAAAMMVIGALLAASMRWPMMWLLGCVAPVAVNEAMAWPGLQQAVETATRLWQGRPVAIFLSLAVASVLLLMALVQSGGPRHVGSDDARRQRVQRFRMRATGGQPVAVGTRGLIDTVLTRPYYGWWRYLLSRPASPVFSRLMLGLGPGAHWTASATAVVGGAAALFAALGVVEALGLVYAPAKVFAPDALGSISTCLVIGLLSPALQVQARLHQSRREQALLVLLPGVARGAALNRRLARRLTAQFLMAWVGALALTALGMTTVHALRPQSLAPDLLTLCRIIAIGALTTVVFQWRPWARVPAPSTLATILPLMLGGLVAMVAWMFPAQGWMSFAQVATVSIGATFAWCAVRWVHMGREPSALPVCRLA